MNLPLDQRPLVVALPGPNGAGKTTFYHAHLQPAGLHFINPDVLARELDLDANPLPAGCRFSERQACESERADTPMA